MVSLDALLHHDHQPASEKAFLQEVNACFPVNRDLLRILLGLPWAKNCGPDGATLVEAKLAAIRAQLALTELDMPKGDRNAALAKGSPAAHAAEDDSPVVRAAAAVAAPALLRASHRQQVRMFHDAICPAFQAAPLKVTQTNCNRPAATFEVSLSK